VTAANAHVPASGRSSNIRDRTSLTLVYANRPEFQFTVNIRCEPLPGAPAPWPRSPFTVIRLGPIEAPVG
jgi:hypothetical protein